MLFGLGISKGYNTILWNFQGWSFVLSGIFRGRVKKKKKNPRVFFKKVCPRHPLFFFSGIAQSKLNKQKRGSVVLLKLDNFRHET